MQPLSSTVREHNLSALADDRFDVLVIGGGVTGTGVALDAAARGYKVALVEKNDFASGTSSKATKLVHGGIRYLPNFDFALVHEALVERGILLQNAPFLVHPLAFVLPIYHGDRHPVGMPFTTPGGIGLGALLDIGLWIYDLMAGKRGVRRHRHLSAKAVQRYAPDLITAGLKDGFVYYDAQTHDARLTLTLMRTAAQYGAVIANYAEVTSFVIEQGRVRGAHVRDVLNNTELEIRARHVVNATGIFSERVEALADGTPEVQVEPSKGVHLVLSREDVRISDAALVLPETEDKRILFLVPWGSRLIFGTTDTGSGDLDHPSAAPDDIAYLLKYLNRYFSLNLTEEQIVSTYAGYRPLFSPRGKTTRSTARLSRTHAVLENATGLVTIVGGKLTTYRRMAQDTMDLLSKRDGTKPRHPTLALPLQGSAAWPEAQGELERRGTRLGLGPETLRQLSISYGSEAHAILDMVENDPSLAQLMIADLPYTWAEVLAACRYEMAMTPYDVLARRTSITLEDRQRGLGVVAEVAARMARELGWSPSQQASLVADYRAAIQRQLATERGTTNQQIMPTIVSQKSEAL
ncbi:MAG TPA: glycerol-3-phosphate dehydrogenase/oxidase [Ktedonobacteraceae bacterium]